LHAKEGTIARPGKATLTKRSRERAKQMKRQDKEERRAQRKAEKADRRPPTDGEDPDLAGLRWGPQAPAF